jgi:hypothetical protein
MKIQRQSPALRPIQPTPEPQPKPKTVVQQNTDFTAEGAPPPGKVGTDVPAVQPAALSVQGQPGVNPGALPRL